MKRKPITLGVAAMLLTGAVGVAYASPNLVNNGDFSATSPSQTAPRQFSNSSGTCGISGNNNWGGQFVSSWNADQGYAVWYPSASAASGTQACTQFGNTGHQYLPTTVTSAPTGTATFIGLDGEPSWRAQVSQTIGGLTTGDQYTVSFWWASTQEMSRQGETTEQIQVSLGGQSFLTGINTIPTHGWSDWQQASFTFTYDGANSLLSFLSIGTPGGFPPFALLSDVSLTHNVPEPPELALFGMGLLGLGLLTIVARQRALKHKESDGDLAA